MPNDKQYKIKKEDIISLILRKNILSESDINTITIISNDVIDILNEYSLEHLKKLKDTELTHILLKEELSINGEDDKLYDKESIKILLKDKLRGKSSSKLNKRLNDKDEVIITSKKNKIVDIKSDIQNIIFELNVYKIESEELLETSYINLIDENEKSIFIYDDKISFNPGMHLRKLGYTDGYYKIKYNFYKNIIGTHHKKNMFIKEISPSRKEIIISIIPRNNRNFDKDTDSEFINISNTFSNIKYNNLSYFINFGNSKRHLLINGQYNRGNIYIKLYEPLNDELGIKDTFWLSNEEIPEYEDKIMLFTEKSADLSSLNYLRLPEFDYRKVSRNNVITGFVNFDELTSLNPSNRNNIISRIFSQSLMEGIELNIDYSNFSNFIYYSSAERRLKNFHYKIRQIETFQNNINTLSVLSGSGYTVPWTGSNYTSSSISSSIRSYEHNIDNIINKFDRFERYLYFESSSYVSSSYGIFPSVCWPKSNNTNPYVNYSYSSSEAINWYKEMLTSASLYDRQNQHKLQDYIPIEIQNEDLNHRYVTLVNKIGQQLDVNYNYIKHLTKLNEYENSVNKGIPSDLLVERLTHFGMPIHGGYSVIDLPDFILATGSDFTFSLSGSDIHH